MNEHIMPAMSGTPDYEQKELRSNGKHVSAVLRMAWAELLLIRKLNNAFFLTFLLYKNIIYA